MIGTDAYHITIEIPSPEDVSASDYRYSNIEVTTIKIQDSMSTEVIEPIKAQSLGEGIIRLYREFEDDSPPVTAAPPIPVRTQETNADDGTVVSILAVPTYFTATDLLGFIGEKNMKLISHLRILKSEKPNRFLVLIKFRDIINAAEFQYQYDGKSFNSMEPETCHVVYVKSVKLDYDSDESETNPKDPMLPFLMKDPFTSTQIIEDNSNTLIELPSCPVCLERMDSEITGLLTIPCQHTFHCQCLSKWRDDSCPICRYSNNFSNQQVRRSVRRLSSFSMHRRPHLASSTQGATSSSTLSLSGPTESTESCLECSVDSGLWICLVCGNIGCGRYAPEQHSLKHFINTGHCFAMEIDTSRVWDYAGDNYVHRLVTNESDGKLVELPEKTNSQGKESNSADKVDEVGFEYSQLLISQLASQREYYESLLQEREAPKSRKGSGITTISQHHLTELEIKVEDLTSKFSHLQDELIPSLRGKIIAKDAKIEKIASELNSTNSLNEGLSKKIEYLEESNSKLKKEIETITEEKQGLSEQVTDLMFFLDSQEKFKDEPDDVKDGTIVVQQNPVKKTRQKKRR